MLSAEEAAANAAARMDEDEEIAQAPPGQHAYWLDHEGGLLGPAPLAGATGWEKHADRNHRIMRPLAGQLVQAVSWCGHRVHEVPGRGPVDCPECLEIEAEEGRET